MVLAAPGDSTAAAATVARPDSAAGSDSSAQPEKKPNVSKAGPGSADAAPAKQGFLAPVRRALKRLIKIRSDSVSVDDRILTRTEKSAMRLSEEQWKLKVVFGEMDRLATVLQDMRDLQLYPASLTRTNPKWSVAFDKKLEKKEKEIKEIRSRVDALSRPLLDAVAILREMTMGEFNRDMVDILDQENRDRTVVILQVKREINAQWETIGKLFHDVWAVAGLEYPRIESQAGFDAEFFAILYSNLGRNSDLFYDKLRVFKDTLAARGTQDTWRKMAAVDLARIQERLQAGLYEISALELQNLIERYNGRIEIGALYYLYGKSLLLQGRHREAQETFAKVAAGSNYRSRALLGQLQALFLLDDFPGVLAQFGVEWLDTNLTAGQRNFAILMGAQAAYRTARYDSVINFVTAARADRKYYAELVYALAQVYLIKGDQATAQKLWEKVLSLPASARGDAALNNRTTLMLAYLAYEQGKYEQALNLFFKIADDPRFFADALYGIVWCYMKLGNPNEAEIALRKMVNQNPDNPLAVEGILLLGKKIAAQAELEWNYSAFCREEAVRIRELSERLERRRADGASATVLNEAAAQLDTLEQRHSKRKPLRRDQISQLFSRSLEICDMVVANYKSGMYLETQAAGRRENLIRQLSELQARTEAQRRSVAAMEVRATETAQRADVATIKDAVQRARIFKISVMMRQQNWETENADQVLISLNARIDSLRKEATTSADSVAKAAARKGVARYQKARGEFVIVTEQEKAARRSRIIDVIERCGKEYRLTGDQEQYLLFQLAELRYDEAKDAFLAELARYDEALVRFDSLATLAKTRDIPAPEPPVEPKPEYGPCMAIFQDLISRYPDGVYTGSALYSLAFCYNDLGRDTVAREHFEKLAQKFPQNPHAAQACMAVGEFWFDRAELEKSVAAYSKVLTYAESEWFDEAIYKLGWSYYRLSKTKKAISSFVYLMSDNGLNLGKESVSKTKSLLEKESIDYIAISFAEEDTTWQGGIEKAKAFLGRIRDDRTGMRILHKLADVYRAQGTEASLKLARKTYETLLDMFPYYDNNPQVELDLIAVLEKQGVNVDINASRMEIFRRYNHRSSWAKSKSDDRVVARGDSISSSALFEAARRFALDAAQNNDVAIYKQAMDAYRRFIDTYPGDTRSADSHYNIAEILFSLGQYQNAAQEYMRVSRIYQKSTHQETAAWNAIVSAQNFKKLRLQAEAQQ